MAYVVGLSHIASYTSHVRGEGPKSPQWQKPVKNKIASWEKNTLSNGISKVKYWQKLD